MPALITPSRTAPLPHRLEPLAIATNTSTHMPIYHFNTRDALLRAVLGHARQRQLDTSGGLLRARHDEPDTAILDHAWTSITGPDEESDQGRVVARQDGA
ncbi:hypothetical protein [Streptomyces sp. NPDC090798]|uniref:hypothetical protein n=1 Tax=Streptomyces sp. NPDC090798 TaxID=3365968 RepID=UPI0037FD42DE